MTTPQLFALENAMFDFAFHLPRRAKLHRGVGKWVVKTAAAEVLPREIVYARKKDFPTPGKFSRGMQHLLAGGMLAELMEWPADVTHQTIAMLGDNTLLRLHVVGLELWARIFFRGETPAELADRLAALAQEEASPARRSGEPCLTRLSPYWRDPVDQAVAPSTMNRVLLGSVGRGRTTIGRAS